MTGCIPHWTQQEASKRLEETTKKDCALILLKAQFDCLWKQVEDAHVVNEFCKYLEEYEFYDIDRARGIIREEGP